MSKVTSKFQVSLPKAVTEKAGIRIGDELSWEAQPGALRAVRVSATNDLDKKCERLRQFDAVSARQSERELNIARPTAASEDRGWRRDDLYER